MIDLNFLKENPELASNLKFEVSGADLLAFGESIFKKGTEVGKKNTHKEPEEYLTPQQYAATLQISLVTLWAWDKKGITIPLHIGNKKLYRRSDLEKILQS
jgi:hypothetical protein